MNKTRVIIFGAGKLGTKTVDLLLDKFTNVAIEAIIDNKLGGQEKCYRNIDIIPPKEAVKIDVDYILISKEFEDEMKKQLIDLQFPSEKIVAYGSCSIIQKFFLESYYKQNPQELSEEISELLEYVNVYGLGTFNYAFVKKYDDLEIDAYFDKKADLYYVIHNNKKMYMSRKYNTPEKVIAYYKSLLVEQDEKSPHKYLDDGFKIKKGEYLLDGGAAEGIFTLDVIEKIAHAYLVEANEEWIEALSHTFKPYQKKITVINHFLSESNSGGEISLDKICNKYKISFIKLDIEGAEISALRGGTDFLKGDKDVRLTVCAYHRPNDEKEIRKVLEDCGFSVMNTDGFMYFPNYDGEDRFVRGILRAEKQ